MVLLILKFHERHLLGQKEQYKALQNVIIALCRKLTFFGFHMMKSAFFSFFFFFFLLFFTFFYLFKILTCLII